jgi:predicted AlkP superfamily pyrophosphatase or phosphodiesterase
MFAQQSRRLVLVSVDGLRARTLHDAEKLGLRIPNLKEFRDGGATAEGLQGVFPTVTYPSHTTMVTGRLPAQHGITGNNLFDPEREMNGAWFWYSELIRVPTLWDAAKAAGLQTGAVSWPVTVGAGIDFNIPEFRDPRTLDDHMVNRAVTTPGLLRDFEKAHGRLDIKGEHFDRLRADLAAFILRTRKPHLMLVHLADFDHDQHLRGPEHPDALRTLEAIDECIGLLRKAVADAGEAAETRWLIVSDHGFFPVEKAFHFEALLTSLGLAGTEGKRDTWRVATHANGGSIAFVSRDPKDLEAQTQLRKTLDRLQQDGAWGIDRILGRRELESLKAYPQAFLAVSMAKGWTTGSARSGPWVTSSGNTRGMHGYAPGAPELDCTFVAFGPGIQARRLPRAQLVDVGLTAAGLLGLTMAGTEGRNLLAPSGAQAGSAR